MLLWAFASAAAEGIYHSALVFEMGRLELRERTREGEGGKVLPMCVCVCVCVSEWVGGWVGIHTHTHRCCQSCAHTTWPLSHGPSLCLSLCVCIHRCYQSSTHTTWPLSHGPSPARTGPRTSCRSLTYYVTSSYILCHIIIRTMTGSYWTPDVMQVSFAIF